MKTLTTYLYRLDCALYQRCGRPFDHYRSGQRPQHRRALLFVLLVLLVLLLASCSTTRPSSPSKPLVVEHDARTRTAEPTPSRIK